MPHQRKCVGEADLEKAEREKFQFFSMLGACLGFESHAFNVCVLAMGIAKETMEGKISDQEAETTFRGRMAEIL